ncbi:reverse transcriptase domain-containing protein [Tanacetum coccineum]
MAEEDENKTTFFTGEGVYYYRKMPFGLKNARATYQRLVDKVFNDQIGRNLKAYIDDIVIKSTSEEDMLADINETFQSYQYGNLPHEGPKPIAVRPSMKLGQRDTPCASLNVVFLFVLTHVIQDLAILQASQELFDSIEA